MSYEKPEEKLNDAWISENDVQSSFPISAKLGYF